MWRVFTAQKQEKLQFVFVQQFVNACQAIQTMVSGKQNLNK